jgi:hypothetical protein
MLNNTNSFQNRPKGDKTNIILLLIKFIKNISKVMALYSLIFNVDMSK